MAGSAAKRGVGITWTMRLVLCTAVALAVLVAVEIVMRRHSASLMTDVVDIQTPATLAAKVRFLGQQTGKRIVLLGDSLVAGQVMREHGDGDWRRHTLSADLQRRFDAEQRNGATVLNLAMNGILPADMETLVNGILPLKPDVIVIDVSLRSFSRDFAAPDAVNSRGWLKPGLQFRSDGSVSRLLEEYGPEKTLERLLLNYWTTYRLRDYMRARFMGGEPQHLLQALRARLEEGPDAPRASPAAEMRLLLQVRGRYETASLDTSNPQYAAWVRMLEKLKAANQKTIVFYATESPRLLPGLIEPDRYRRLTEQLRRSVTRYGDLFSYLGPNRELTDDMFLDHVHVNAEGNRIYGNSIFDEFDSQSSQAVARTAVDAVHRVRQRGT